MASVMMDWRRATTSVAFGAMLALAGPALADVKAGVDAWARGDYPRAIAEWRGPALAGDADAQFNMGQAYKLGRGVPVDLPQAEIWYQKAAVQGHAQAQDSYGLALFQDGRRADALPWLEKSAARDEKRTELVLGTMLFNGDAVPKDWVRAYALVSRSSQQGLPQASQTLAQMDGYLSPEQRQQGVALAGRIADGGRAAQMAALAGPSPTRGAGSSAGPAPARNRSAPGVMTADVPASTAPSRTPSASRDEPHAQPLPPVIKAERPRPVPLAPRQVARAAPSTPPRVQPAVPGGGRWKVQLGAFRDEGNARTLWSRVGGRVGGQPIYAKAGVVTRLQAGPFASKADAERACRAAGSGCVVVP